MQYCLLEEGIGFYLAIPTERICVLRALQEAGVETWLFARPVGLYQMETYSAQSL
jgi:hypothetical protein